MISKSLQDMHKHSLDIEPFLGLKKDLRDPLQFVKEFQSRIYDKLGDDQIAGDIFMALINKSP